MLRIYQFYAVIIYNKKNGIQYVNHMNAKTIFCYLVCLILYLPS